MPKIERWIIDKVLDATSIVEVIGDFVELRKAGVNYTGCCPFHDDHHDGNFIVRPEGVKSGGGTYRCFVCDAKGGAVQFLMNHEHMTFPDAIRWLGKKYNIDVDDVPIDYTPPLPRPKPLPLETLSIPRDVVGKSMRYTQRDRFCNWLRSLPWETKEERDRIEKTLWRYCVGHWRDGRVIFWQIDESGNVRSGKLMRYLHDGHRDKKCNPGWMHNQKIVREQIDFEHTEFRSTLFGMHLVSKYPQATIHLVESEKTALICAIHFGEIEQDLFLACGGLKNLRADTLHPLIDMKRNICLWPDKDGIEEWRKLLDKFNYNRVVLYTDFLDQNWCEEDGMKADAADNIIRKIQNVEEGYSNEGE